VARPRPRRGPSAGLRAAAEPDPPTGGVPFPPATPVLPARARADRPADRARPRTPRARCRLPAGGERPRADLVRAPQWPRRRGRGRSGGGQDVGGLIRRRADHDDGSGGGGGEGVGVVSATAEPPLVEVRDLVKHFPTTKGILLQRTVGAGRAVDGLSFEVPRGETL